MGARGVLPSGEVSNGSSGISIAGADHSSSSTASGAGRASVDMRIAAMPPNPRSIGSSSPRDASNSTPSHSSRGDANLGPATVALSSSEPSSAANGRLPLLERSPAALLRGQSAGARGPHNRTNRIRPDKDTLVDKVSTPLVHPRKPVLTRCAHRAAPPPQARRQAAPPSRAFFCLPVRRWEVECLPRDQGNHNGHCAIMHVLYRHHSVSMRWATVCTAGST